MADIIDVVYRLRDMAGIAADKLRAEIAEAQAVLDKLDAFATGAQDAGELVAASDLAPNSRAYPPTRAGMVRIDPPDLVDFEHNVLGRVKGKVLSMGDGGFMQVRLDEPIKHEDGSTRYPKETVVSVKMADAVIPDKPDAILPEQS